jgi:teichuronic acid biosynthesis glycosyltransferase TuaG
VRHLVSIIMPAYNAERYISQAIQSVIEQTYTDWELIVVDDGSTDGTAEIAQNLGAADDRIKYVFQQNSRLGKARNTGLENSTGGLIAFLDSDDLWVKEKLGLQVKVMEETEADVVFSDAFVFHEDNVTDESRTFSNLCGRFEGREMFNRLLIDNRIPVLTVLARKGMIERVGPFEERPYYHGCEDYDLWLRLAKHGVVFYGMEERLGRYRRHATAMTHSDSNVLKPMLAVVKKHLRDSSLDERQVKARVRGLYRQLISALIEEGKIAEAKAYMKELSAWDRSGVVTAIQKILLEALPGKYNFISRECLYRIEWHLGKLVG